MKRKDYEKLLDKLWHADRAFSGWRMEYDDYDEVRQPLSKKEAKIEMDKAKAVLDKYKAELEDILTVDMEVFAERFLKHINSLSGVEYEMDVPTINGIKLWIARPKNKKSTTFKKLVEEEKDIFILGAGDKKILPQQAVYIDEMRLPTMYSVGKYFSVYNLMQGKYDVKYRQFEKTFMQDLENELVESYDLKKKKRM